MTSAHPRRDLSPLATAAARSLASLAPAVEGLEASVDRRDLAAAVTRGAFRPAEDERLKAVVYRAYDGLEGFHLELRERAGRLTLAAEYLLDLALAGELFEPVCVFGARGCEGELVAGEGVGEALAASYREDLQSG